MESRDKTILDDTHDEVNSFTPEEMRENIVNGSESGQTDAEESQTQIAEQIEKYKKESEDNKDKYVRLFAEFENYKRRSAKERMETIQTAGKEVIMSLLDVADDCDRAERQINKSTDIDEIKQGVQLVFNKLRNTLQSRGLKAMESINTDFDVEKHEAVSEIEIADKSKKGKVIDEIMKGYYLNDKLIRFAKVIVGK